MEKSMKTLTINVPILITETKLNKKKLNKALNKNF